MEGNFNLWNIMRCRRNADEVKLADKRVGRGFWTVSGDDQNAARVLVVMRGCENFTGSVGHWDVLRDKAVEVVAKILHPEGGAWMR